MCNSDELLFTFAELLQSVCCESFYFGNAQQWQLLPKARERMVGREGEAVS
jgi:hypothetical protein